MAKKKISKKQQQARREARRQAQFEHAHSKSSFEHGRSKRDKTEKGGYEVCLYAPKDEAEAIDYLLSLTPKGYENEWFESVSDSDDWHPASTTASVVLFNGDELTGAIPTLFLYKDGFYPNTLGEYLDEAADGITRKVAMSRIAEMKSCGYGSRIMNPGTNTCAAIVIDYEKGQRIFPVSGEALICFSNGFQQVFGFDDDIHKAAKDMLAEAGYLLAA